MPNLTLNIEISENQFQEMIKNNATELPKEVIQQILLDTFKETVQNEKKLFVLNSGYAYDEIKPTALTEKLLANITETSELKEMLNDVAKTLKENYLEILLAAISSAVSNVLFDCDNKMTMTNTIAEQLFSRLP